MEEAFSSMQGPIIIGANLSYLQEAAAAMHSRMVSTGISFYALMEDLGDYAACINAINDNPLSLLPEPQKDDAIAAFYMNLALLVRFLYPTLEQLYASVERHVKFESADGTQSE